MESALAVAGEDPGGVEAGSAEHRAGREVDEEGEGGRLAEGGGQAQHDELAAAAQCPLRAAHRRCLLRLDRLHLPHTLVSRQRANMHVVLGSLGKLTNNDRYSLTSQCESSSRHREQR